MRTMWEGGQKSDNFADIISGGPQKRRFDAIAKVDRVPSKCSSFLDGEAVVLVGLDVALLVAAVDLLAEGDVGDVVVDELAERHQEHGGSARRIVGGAPQLVGDCPAKHIRVHIPCLSRATNTKAIGLLMDGDW